MFITFEGPDGSGKTYQMALLNKYLKAKGFTTLTTREPGGTSIGDQIRAILNNLDNTSMHPRTEILLFQASRAQHVEQVIMVDHPRKPHRLIPSPWLTVRQYRISFVSGEIGRDRWHILGTCRETGSYQQNDNKQT